MEETNQLERILQSGKMPKDFDTKYGLSKEATNGEAVEGMDTEENQQGMDEEYNVDDNM